MSPVPVLMYHHINPHKGDLVTVVPEIFHYQIKYLSEHGYRTLTINELIAYVKGELSLRQKAVVITFDDGWLDNYIYAYPVLKKYNIHATIFVVTDRLDKASENCSAVPLSVPDHKESKLLIEKGEEYKVTLNWKLTMEMSDSGLVEFHSHTRSHRRCDCLSEDELAGELGDSRMTIEKMLGRSSLCLCWPYGKYNDSALKTARQAGYKAVFTTHQGIVNKGSDLFALNRIVVKNKSLWFKKIMHIYTNSLLSSFYLKLKKKEI